MTDTSSSPQGLFRCSLFGLLLVLSSVVSLTAAEPIRVLIVDGQNNHDWQRTTPYIQDFLTATGRFDVEVATTPEKGSPEEAWNGFRPRFSRYDVVLSNYNGETWPEPVRGAFESYVQNGGGVVNVHAANNPFPDWDAFNQMIGLAWRPATFGSRLVLNDAGETVTVPPGEGPGAGHGPQHAYPVIVRDREHPVMQGFPPEWMHPADELYHGQRGPAEGMHLLATAYSAPDQRGTGFHEPMVWWIGYGQGKVFTTLLGHVGRNQPAESWPMRDRAFQAVVCRGCEWVAAGNVTLPLPAEMPTGSDVSLAPPAAE
ncbi:MAG: ThuA domain-containing protein [Planctomycetaceae bacterium]|nr:ThuA domain-containing protein [Planctomycetaceae bacterium]